MKAFTNFSVRIAHRYLPDAFLFATILTLLVFVLGIAFTESSSIQMLKFWGDGFWKLLAFAMQMALIVATGYILADTPIVRNSLTKLSKLAKTPGQAIVLVTFVGLIGSWINYGFGLVVGALMAVYLVRQIPTVNFHLLVASGYSGYIVWHGGLSGSAPLLVATEGHFLADIIGVIPASETLFSNSNIFILLALFITLPILNWFLNRTSGPMDMPNKVTWQLSDDEEEKKPLTPEGMEVTPASWLEKSPLIPAFIGLLGIAYVINHFLTKGFDLNLNIVIFIFLFLGIIFHRTPQRYLGSVQEGVKNVGGIMIQFPFYAGIMGMMVGSGLSVMVAQWFISISNEFTLPLFTFLSAGLLNIFIPSGGGQWAVQGPIIIPAAIELGVSVPKTVIAYAWGDAWTNMIQPFWALPVLAISGLKARDIMGFCAIVMFYSFIPIAIGLLLF
jgi:short-chain fatty acids transporter